MHPAGEPTDPSLDSAELSFLNSFRTVLEAGQYRLLTGQEWETAMAENFLVSVRFVCVLGEWKVS